MTSNPGIIVRPMNGADDRTAVATLIYDTDEGLFGFLFGRKHKAVSRLSQLVKRKNNAFSYQRIMIAMQEGHVAGILIESDPKQQNDDNKAFSAVFNWIELTGLFMKTVLLFPLFSEARIKGRYIQNISVSKQAQGQGIGTLLIKDAIARAKADIIGTLTLDVSIANEGARRLYQRLGFDLVRKRRVWGIFPVTYRMELTVHG